MVREAEANDFQGLMALYTQLHNNAMPPETKEIKQLWHRILNDSAHISL